MDAYFVYLVLEGVRGLGLGLVIVAAIYQIYVAAHRAAPRRAVHRAST
jgi:hypothetical protein